MFMTRVAKIDPAAFLTGIAKQSGQESSDLVSKLYGITAGMDQNLCVTQAMRWIGDVVFDGNETIVP